MIKQTQLKNDFNFNFTFSFYFQIIIFLIFHLLKNIRVLYFNYNRFIHLNEIEKEKLEGVDYKTIHKEC
jgi:hypothetical protein